MHEMSSARPLELLTDEDQATWNPFSKNEGVFNMPKTLNNTHRISVLFDLNKKSPALPHLPKMRTSYNNAAKLKSQRLAKSKQFPLQFVEDAHIFVNPSRVQLIKKLDKAKSPNKKKNIMREIEVRQFFIIDDQQKDLLILPDKEREENLEVESSIASIARGISIKQLNKKPNLLNSNIIELGPTIPLTEHLKNIAKKKPLPLPLLPLRQPNHRQGYPNHVGENKREPPQPKERKLIFPLHREQHSEAADSFEFSVSTELTQQDLLLKNPPAKPDKKEFKHFSSESSNYQPKVPTIVLTKPASTPSAPPNIDKPLIDFESKEKISFDTPSSGKSSVEEEMKTPEESEINDGMQSSRHDILGSESSDNQDQPTSSTLSIDDSSTFQSLSNEILPLATIYSIADKYCLKPQSLSKLQQPLEEVESLLQQQPSTEENSLINDFKDMNQQALFLSEMKTRCSNFLNRGKVEEPAGELKPAKTSTEMQLSEFVEPHIESVSANLSKASISHFSASHVAESANKSSDKRKAAEQVNDPNQPYNLSKEHKIVTHSRHQQILNKLFSLLKDEASQSKATEVIEKPEGPNLIDMAEKPNRFCSGEEKLISESDTRDISLRPKCQNIDFMRARFLPLRGHDKAGLRQFPPTKPCPAQQAQDLKLHLLTMLQACDKQDLEKAFAGDPSQINEVEDSQELIPGALQSQKGEKVLRQLFKRTEELDRRAEIESTTSFTSSTTNESSSISLSHFAPFDSEPCLKRSISPAMDNHHPRKNLLSVEETDVEEEKSSNESDCQSSLPMGGLGDKSCAQSAESIQLGLLVRQYRLQKSILRNLITLDDRFCHNGNIYYEVKKKIKKLKRRLEKSNCILKYVYCQSAKFKIK